MSWMEPKYYQGMDVDDVNICKGERYKNLWDLNNKERQTENNIQFYFYLDALWDVERKIPQLTNEVATKYRRLARLEIGLHVV